jgi:TolA-binding protein
VSDTPRTDAKRGFHDLDTAVDAEFSEQLERELNVANDRIKRLDDIIKHQEKVIKRLEDVEYRLMQERITD